MKNVLIPTNFGPDTLTALKTAILSAQGQYTKVVMLSLSDMPDGIHELLFNTQIGKVITDEQRAHLNACRQYARQFEHIQFEVHYQYGISSPLLRNIVSLYEIGLIIITPSYKAARTKIDNLCVKLLNNTRFPILHLPEVTEEIMLQYAVVVEKDTDNLTVSDIESQLHEQLALQVVGTATINSSRTMQEVAPIIEERMAEQEVHVLVETRQPEPPRWRRSKKDEGFSVAGKLGIPVVSILHK